MPMPIPVFDRLPAVSRGSSPEAEILRQVMSFRRLPPGYELGPGSDHGACEGSSCPSCAAVHLPKIRAAVRAGQPIVFVLPAFPGKSPNPEKVLGPLPDQAERLALRFLAGLAREIQAIYSPGVRIIICSDGRVFSDVVGMNELDVTAYREELHRLIAEIAPAVLGTFDLEDVFGGGDFVHMRETLMKRFGSASSGLREKVRRGADASASPPDREATRMYRGITRFLFEDALHPGQTKSRTALQNEARAKAYEVIARSNAWGELVAATFPEAVRLSIHPQTCGSEKLGIRLVANESWITPWHGVAARTKEGFVLMKHAEAKRLGGRLVFSADGRPSHFDLRNEFLEVVRAGDL